MERRNFNKSLALLALSGLNRIDPNLFDTNSDYKMGYQLYSIRDEMAKDPIATLKALKAMGYQDFELYGYEDLEDNFYGFKSKEFKSILDDLNLTITSGHYGFSPYLDKSIDELKAYVDRCIVGAKALNSDYITWPWIAPKQRTMDYFKLMAQRLNVIGEQVTQAGLSFAYHNHGFEFEDHDGETGFDIILRDTDSDLVKLEMDMYWVMHSANFTPKDIVEDQPGRVTLWHIKDMDKLTRDYTELGNGSIDYHQELPDPKKSGLQYYYIEQGGNFTINSTESARSSAEYMKSDLIQYLKR